MQKKWRNLINSKSVNGQSKLSADVHRDCCENDNAVVASLFTVPVVRAKKKSNPQTIKYGHSEKKIIGSREELQAIVQH